MEKRSQVGLLYVAVALVAFFVPWVVIFFWSLLIDPWYHVAPSLPVHPVRMPLDMLIFFACLGGAIWGLPLAMLSCGVLFVVRWLLSLRRSVQQTPSSPTAG